MNRQNTVIPLRRQFRDHPVRCCIALALLTLLILQASNTLFRGLPGDAALLAGLNQTVHMVWPVLLTWLLGYGWCYRRDGFGRTLLAELFLFILQLLALFSAVMLTLSAPDVQWAKPAQIVVGVLTLVGVGIREESLFRGIVANALGISFGGEARGVWRAVILSGLLFGLMHLINLLYGVALRAVLIQTVMAVMIGIYFTAVYYRGGNLWALILLHSLTDTAGLFRSSFTQMSSTVEDISNLNPASLILIPVFLCLTAFLLRRKKMEEVIQNLQRNAAVDAKSLRRT